MKHLLLVCSLMFLGCAQKRPPELLHTGPLKVHMKLSPQAMQTLGEARLIVRLEGTLPENAGYILAWEPGCKSTQQSFEAPDRVYYFTHNWHSLGEKMVIFSLVDLDKQQIVASASAYAQVGIEEVK